jgi:GDP-L-fucose synthase
VEKDAKIYVAGHTGLVGSALVLELQRQGYTNSVVRTSQELDLCDTRATNDFFAQEKPAYVFLAAAKVGGIKANNDHPADFIYKNLMISTNVIDAAYRHGVKKLLFLGSSCIYPRLCPQPIKEEYLMTGPLEPTNDAYALAKISGLKMCQAYNRQHGTNFIAAMPTNLYGPRDNFSLDSGHALPALIARMSGAKERGDKEVVVWGTGAVYREFLYVDDCAQALIFLMNNHDGSEIVNVGTGQDATIKELAQQVQKAVGFKGALVFDTTKPDGMPRKLLDVSRLLALGWRASTSLEEGIEKTVVWYNEHMKERKI